MVVGKARRRAFGASRGRTAIGRRSAAGDARSEHAIAGREWALVVSRAFDTTQIRIAREKLAALVATIEPAERTGRIGGGIGRRVDRNRSVGVGVGVRIRTNGRGGMFHVVGQQDAAVEKE
jgi:hypothetical protein